MAIGQDTGAGLFLWHFAARAAMLYVFVLTHPVWQLTLQSKGWFHTEHQKIDTQYKNRY
jgi:hypothetical protein